MTSRDRTADIDADLRRTLTAWDDLAMRAPAIIERDTRGGANEHDGYPTSSIGDGGNHTFTVGSTSSTAAAGEARADDGPDRRDDYHRAATAIEQHLAKAREHLEQATAMCKLADHIANPDDRHSNPPTDCIACNRTVQCTTADPIRAGYCGECSDAWYRWRKRELAAHHEPDRARFEKQRREQKAKAS